MEDVAGAKLLVSVTIFVTGEQGLMQTTHGNQGCSSPRKLGIDADDVNQGKSGYPKS